MQQSLRRAAARRAAVGVAAIGTLFGLAGCAGDTPAPGCGALEVRDAWVRQAPSGAEVMGAYMTLANAGDDKVVVHGVTSTQFERVEMHETVVNDQGQASMQPLERVAVPAGDDVAFEPGGKHLMLFTGSQDYAAGDQVELVLACGSDNDETAVAAVVRSESPATGEEMAGGHDGHAMPDDGSSADDEAAAGR